VRARFYFDFISPYSYLATALIARRAEFNSIELEMRPVVFGSVLSKLGAKGPGEIPARRKAGLADVLMLADLYGIPLAGPPVHPFNSIYALRSVCAVVDEHERRTLARAYFEKTWAEGESLEDLDVLRGVLAELGIAQDPEEAATSSDNRRMLKLYTEELLAFGGWGVPTFVVGEGEDRKLFFGHDRLELLTAVLQGRARLDETKLAELLARPQPGRII
jgi:2-hydroxychromene-2-carboxylate isomerase